MTSSVQVRIKPSRWFYVIGIVILVGGPITSSIFLFSAAISNIGDMTEVPSVQVVVPGTNDITLSQTGKYTVFYEYRSMVGNRIYSTGENIPGIQVNLVSKDTGAEIPLSAASMNSTYTIGGRSGIGLFDFVIDQPGIYELSASYPASVQGQQQEQSSNIVLAVFHSSAIEKLFGNIMGTVGGVLAIAFVPFAVGIAIIVITFLKRRKAGARARAQQHE
jgi:hypothetical protein